MYTHKCMCVNMSTNAHTCLISCLSLECLLACKHVSPPAPRPKGQAHLPTLSDQYQHGIRTSAQARVSDGDIP